MLSPRIADRISVTDSGCWEWNGARVPRGYGRIRDGKRVFYVHRYVYAALVGDPGGLQLDHLCRNPPCCNPEHLEPVTNRENTVRGVGPESARKRYKEHLYCPKGHPLFGDNLYTHTNRKGYVNKQCKTCRRDTKRARRAAGAKD